MFMKLGGRLKRGPRKKHHIYEMYLQTVTNVYDRICKSNI